MKAQEASAKTVDGAVLIRVVEVSAKVVVEVILPRDRTPMTLALDGIKMDLTKDKVGE